VFRAPRGPPGGGGGRIYCGQELGLLRSQIFEGIHAVHGPW